MKYLKYLTLIACLSLLIIPAVIHTADAATGLNAATDYLTNVGKAAGLPASSSSSGGLPELVGKIINIFLSILGVLFVVLMVYAGYLWMTSYGDEKKVSRAKELIVDATLGLIIILAAYAISNFVVGSLIKAVSKS